MSTHLHQIKNWEKLAREAQWSPKALAEKCHVCARTLQRHFEQTKGMSPRKWLKVERLRIGREKLLNGANVKEAAIELQYQQANHFSRDFRETYGYPPSQEAKFAKRRS